MKKFNNILISLVFFLLFTTSAFAHKSPDVCTGSGLNISLYTDKNEAHAGDTISFSVTVFNGLGFGPIVCDVTGITASLSTPDGVIHPIALARTSLSNGQQDSYNNVVTYVVRTQDIQSGMLKVSAKDRGNVHQNDTDTLNVGGDQSLNIEIEDTPPPPSPSPTPTPTPTPSPTPTPTPTSHHRGGGGSPSVEITPTPTPVVEVVPPPIIEPVHIFPKTGFGPEENSGLLLLTAVLATLSIFYVVFKKNTV